MDPQMLQMFAEKMSMSPEQVSMLNNISEMPPAARVSALMQMMNERSQEEDPQAEAFADMALQLRKAELRTQVLEEKLVQARTAIAYIGETLGLCPECWGTLSNCPMCGGGALRRYTPDEDQLRRLVAPALDRLGLTIVSADESSALEHTT
jgi:hypothetical protein